MGRHNGDLGQNFNKIVLSDTPKLTTFSPWGRVGSKQSSCRSGKEGKDGAESHDCGQMAWWNRNGSLKTVFAGL